MDDERDICALLGLWTDSLQKQGALFLGPRSPLIARMDRITTLSPAL